jgi:hypothetical protein
LVLVVVLGVLCAFNLAAALVTKVEKCVCSVEMAMTEVKSTSLGAVAWGHPKLEALWGFLVALLLLERAVVCL